MKHATIIMENSEGDRKYFEISCKTENQINKEIEKYENSNIDYYVVEVINGWIDQGD